MKSTWLYIFILFLYGMFVCSSIDAKNNKCTKANHSSILVKSSPFNSDSQPTGNSPFIRFHHGIESSISVSTPHELVIILKAVNDVPEKFAGILSYLSSLDFRLPVTREIFYSTPLRSPPAIN